MGKEDYVSLEVAKLLKEKGFNERCERRFVEKIDGTEREGWNDDLCAICEVYDVIYYPKPTLYEAAKWLRVNHRILVTPYYVTDDKYTYHILRMDEGNNYCHNYSQYDSYEEALNAGIEEALKLI